MGILDGTYLFCEKSIDYHQQKLTWSSHKNDNLVKEMPIQLPSGQWFDTAGPFYSTGIDIHILQALHSFQLVTDYLNAL